MRPRRWWQDEDREVSLTVLCCWFALWMAVLVGGDLISPTGAVKEARKGGIQYGGESTRPAFEDMLLRAHTRGAWPGAVRVWRQLRAVLPFLPSEAVLGLPDDWARWGGVTHGLARFG